jgi:hypothetical protein
MPFSTIFCVSQAADGLARVVNRAARWVHQTADGPERCGLARAVGADQGDDGARFHIKGDALERLDASEADFQILDGQKAHAFFHPR